MNTNAVNPIYPIYPITRVLHNHGFCHLSGRGQSGGGRIRLFTYRDVVFQVTRTYEDDRVNLFFASVDGGETSDCGYIIIAKSEERNKAIVGTEQAIVGTKQKTPSYLHVDTRYHILFPVWICSISCGYESPRQKCSQGILEKCENYANCEVERQQDPIETRQEFEPRFPVCRSCCEITISFKSGIDEFDCRRCV